MNLPQSARQAAVSRDQHDEAHTRLHGRWLVFCASYLASHGHPLARAVRHLHHTLCHPTDRPRQSPTRTHAAS